MKQTIQNILCFLMVCILLPSSILADGQKPSEIYFYHSNEYVIDRYDINMIVNENNTLDITETITAYFNVPKHGILRKIPLKNKVERLDGTSSNNRAKISNLRVNTTHTVSKSFDTYQIKIGNRHQELTGEQVYSIQYNYNIGKDPLENADELYWNLIGSNWDTAIGNITFKITMPKAFDASKIGFSVGKKGSSNHQNVTYDVHENTIEGAYYGILEAGEALTIRCELEEGYFVNAGFPTQYTDYIGIVISVLCFMISLYLWYRYGRNEQVVETVEFYPPEKFNSLEIGFLYKGIATTKDVTSLLISLANKGYIKISEINHKTFLANANDFKITKLKEYEGDNVYENLFMKGLFESGKKEVTQMDLYDRFYSTKDMILDIINVKGNKAKIFEKYTFIPKLLIGLMILISYCSFTISLVLGSGNFHMLCMSILVYTVFLIFEFMMFKKDSTAEKIINIFFHIIFMSFLVAVFGPYIVLPMLESRIILINSIVCIICNIGMAVCFNYMPKRTKYGNQMLGRILGFKHFLETAEKEKLETLVLQDPSYFYHILPYTYVLGVSDKWIQRFETISLQAPEWYDSLDTFDIKSFESFMNSTMETTESVSSSSSDSDSSGGGISDGGSGGGGGSSW